LGKSSLFRIGKPPSTSVASSSSSTERWIDASTLGLFHPAGHGEGGGVFSNLYSRYVAGPPGEHSGSMPASATDVYPFGELGSLNINDLPLVSSWSSYADRMMSEYIRALTLGCVIGAAVATGASVGLLAASGILRARNQYVPVLYGWFARICGADETTTTSDPDFDATDNNRSQTDDVAQAQVAIVSSGNSKSASLVLLKTSGSARCEKCLDDVFVLLSKNGATWKTVRQLSVYLVSPGIIEPSHFRQALKGYPVDADACIVSTRFVQRLEDVHSMIEIEALATVTD
jgi:hypothetical protein